jgi:hypothetical protein
MTPLTAPEAERRLTGQHVRLWPYVRGAWPRETPYRLWQMVEGEQAGERLFWVESAGGLRGQTVGDLHDFVGFLGAERRLVLMAESTAHPGDLAGLFWFDDITVGHKASAGVCYRRRYWGAPAREASHLALGYGFAAWGLASIWAYTPFRIAKRHAEACGMRTVATLPDFIRIGDVGHDLHLCRITREEYGDG